MNTEHLTAKYRLFKTLNRLSRPLLRYNHWLEMNHGYYDMVANYKPLPDDLFIVSYPKSGTTWLQSILYQLLTDGDLEKIRHIAAFSRHFEELENQIGPYPGQPTTSRVFKSHLYYQSIPKTASRYIYVIRNGMDVAISYYHHLRNFRRVQVPFERFFKGYINGKVPYGSWFNHVAGWCEGKDKLNVLFVHYEDLIEDLEGQIRRIAAFCNLEIPETEYARIINRSSFSYMKEHQEKFDMLKQILIATGYEMGKFLRSGKSGEWGELATPEMNAVLKREFDQKLAAYHLTRYEAQFNSLTQPQAEAP